MKNMQRIISFIVFVASFGINAEVNLDNVINLKKWSKAELIELVNDDNYDNNLLLLKDKLSTQIIKSTEELDQLDLSNAKMLASLTGSYFTIFILPRRQIVDVRILQACEKILMTAFDKMKYYPKIIGGAAKRALTQAAQENVSEALKIVGLDPHVYQYQIYEQKFYSVYALAYMAEPSHLAYFKGLYEGLLSAAINEGVVSMTAEQYLALVNQHMGIGSGIENLWEVKTLESIISSSVAR